MTNEKLFSEAKNLLVGGVNSPVRSYSSVGGTPLFIEKGQGALITDVEGKEYIDYVGSFGPTILGHCHKAVVEAIQNQAAEGLGFGAPSKIENQLAARIIEYVPSIEKIRMTSSGTEAALTAIRLARGYTSREIIIKFDGCYHGHVDALLVNAGSGALTLGIAASNGIPEGVVATTLVLPYNDTESLTETFKELGPEIAAVIVEPIAGNMGCVLPTTEFLESLRQLTYEYGTILIFDEVMTGFRVAQGGAQELFGISPDLTLLGKIIGGGLPVGAVGGTADIMDHLAPIGSVYQAGTLSGNPVSMASGLATLKLLGRSELYDDLEAQTANLCFGLERAASDARIPFKCNFTCGMFGMFFTDSEDIRSLKDVSRCDSNRFVKFFHSMLANGVNLAPSRYEAGFLSITHDDDTIRKTVEAAEQSFRLLNN